MRRITTAIMIAALLLVGTTHAAPTTAPSGDADAKYTAMIEKRVSDILAILKIDDAGKREKVHDILIAQYRALNDWQDEHQAKLKDKSLTSDQRQAIIDTRKPLHDKFVADLSEQLTPEQVDQVKDKMTYNTVHVDFDAYCKFVPTLTDEQKAKIMDYLKQAREEAIDGTSQQEKANIFKKYKGKIANYLSAQGIDIKQKTNEYMAAQKGNHPTTAPAQ